MSLENYEHFLKGEKMTRQFTEEAVNLASRLSSMDVDIAEGMGFPSNWEKANGLISVALTSAYAAGIEDAAKESITEGKRRSPKDGVIYVSEKIECAILNLLPREEEKV